MSNNYIRTVNCINVYSDMNTWIDFCIIVNDEDDIDKAKEIIDKAYDDWWELEDASFEPIADWISRNLKEANIDFDIYFKEEKETD